MSAQQKAPKQPQDPYAKHGRTLASAVQRLRGWVGSDPARTPELADALVAVTAHRLLGHGYAAAAADAQESVRLAAQLLTAGGPIGPYTAAPDLARYVDAVVHVATIQCAVGLPEAAGATVESLQGLREQVRELGLEQPWPPRTAVQALACRARAALATGDVAGANACADAAWSRTSAELADDPEAPLLVLDAARLVADARWAAGRGEESLTFGHLAAERYESLVDGRLQEPGRLPPALLERLAEPMAELYRDLADRLVASGETDLGLVTRRTLVDRLRVLAPRLGDAGPVQLATALSDLGRDLLAADRADEAEVAADEALAVLHLRAGGETVRLLAGAVRTGALTRAGRADEAAADLRPLLADGAAESRSAAAGVALLALAGALRATGEEDGAAEAGQRATEIATELGLPLEPSDASRAALLDRARGVVSRGAEPLTWSPLPPEATYAGEETPTTPLPDGVEDQQRSTAAWLDAERAQAHRREQEELEQARVEAGRREAARQAAERAAAAEAEAERRQAEEAERLEAERAAAAEEVQRLERRQRREQRLEAYRLEVERREAERQAELEAGQHVPARSAEQERLELEELQAELDALDREEALEEALEVAAAVAAPTAVDPEAESLAPAEPEPAEPEPVVAEPEPVVPVEPESLVPVEPEPVVPVESEAEQVVPEPASERDEVKPVEPERQEPEPVQPEPELVQPEPVQPETEPEPQPVQPEPEVVQPEPDELALALRTWREAQGRGDRRAARAGVERVVELLRPRAEADLPAYGPPLREALEALASARLRSGDLLGSRSAAREARVLGRRLGS